MKRLLFGLIMASALLVPGVIPAQARPASIQMVAAATPPVDINSASESELQAVKGIGPVYSKAIIAGRPYKSKTELTKRKIVPKGVYNNIKDAIIVKRSK